ncbi:MAG TPA: hypothetical protein VHB48_18680, partial [Chitinophagaceae bacterium]|nr:hypothetical protein [Chitinophagaceae bacterium]
MRIALILISFLLYCRQTPEKITLRTISGDSIVVTEDIIYYNNSPISDKIDGIIYKSNYNRLIEQSGIILLFLEVDDRPSYNKLKAFKLTKQKANELVECVYNDKTQGIGPAPFTDMDKDGKIE